MGPAARPRRDTGRSALATFGIVLAVVVAICGLALVAAFIFFLIAFSSWGSNK